MSTEVISPVEVEQAIRAAANTVARSVRVVSDALAEYRRCQRLFDLAEARAYLHAAGPVAERKYRAVIETETQRAQLDDAEIAWRYAERSAKAAEATLSAYQTISRSVQSMYGAAGIGEY